MRPPRIIGFHSVKGGVGKSTLSVLCAFWAGGREDGGARRVVLVDCDPWADCLKFQQKREKLGLVCPFAVVRGGDFDLKNKVVRNLNPDLIIIDIPPRGVNAVGHILEICDIIAIPHRVGGTEDGRLEEMLADYDAAGLGKIRKVLILNEIESLASNIIVRFFNGKLRGEKTLIENLKAFASERGLITVTFRKSLDCQRLMLLGISPWEQAQKKTKLYQSMKICQDLQVLVNALDI